MGLFLGILVSSIAVYFTAWLLPGISVRSYGSAILVAVVLSLLNAFVKPFLQFISFPITIITLGLFLFVINAFVIMLASWIMGDGFHVKNFFWALLFSVIVSLITSLLSWFIVWYFPPAVSKIERSGSQCVWMLRKSAPYQLHAKF